MILYDSCKPLCPWVSIFPLESYENVDVPPPLRSLIEDNLLQMNEINLLYIKKAPSLKRCFQRGCVTICYIFKFNNNSFSIPNFVLNKRYSFKVKGPYFLLSFIDIIYNSNESITLTSSSGSVSIS